MTNNDIPRCIHCGKTLDDGAHINPWLSPWPVYQCRLVPGGVPVCDEGRLWYVENTVITSSGERAHVRDFEEAQCD